MSRAKQAKALIDNPRTMGMQIGMIENKLGYSCGTLTVDFEAEFDETIVDYQVGVLRAETLRLVGSTKLTAAEIGDKISRRANWVYVAVKAETGMRFSQYRKEQARQAA